MMVKHHAVRARPAFGDVPLQMLVERVSEHQTSADNSAERLLIAAGIDALNALQFALRIGADGNYQAISITADYFSARDPASRAACALNALFIGVVVPLNFLITEPGSEPQARRVGAGVAPRGWRGTSLRCGLRRAPMRCPAALARQMDDRTDSSAFGILAE